ncbi:MAG: hypothetical protein KIIPBIDF_01794 [Candidatus Methanoperedenaceae archaeon GB50]|nr:MAG: hypothetical protein KIIPBIDF_01794 [Candidatus Methanoperedenaceae archaeon GB50]
MSRCLILLLAEVYTKLKQPDKAIKLLEKVEALKSLEPVTLCVWETFILL